MGLGHGPQLADDLQPAPAMELPEGRFCLNCGEALAGKFCSACGQEDVAPHPTVRELASDLLIEGRGRSHSLPNIAPSWEKGLDLAD